MKIGVVGKGGVGKTTVTALLARSFAERGLRVVAVDTDSNPNLGLSLGLTPAATEEIPVLPRSIVVGQRGDVSVEELLGRFGRSTPVGVTVMSALRVNEAGAGCTCGGHATVRSLLGEALDGEDVVLAAEVVEVLLPGGLVGPAVLGRDRLEEDEEGHPLLGREHLRLVVDDPDDLVNPPGRSRAGRGRAC